MTPIATRSLGIDQVSGLEKKVNVWQFTADAKSQKIIVVYNIADITPTGLIEKESDPRNYEIINSPEVLDAQGNVSSAAINAFDDIRSSNVGIAITSMIQGHIDAMQF